MKHPARLACAAAVLALALAPAAPALAWGASGHRVIGRVAMAALPGELPAFLRTPTAIDQVGELAREPDRSKGSGQPHDADSDPGHFIDLDEDGHVFNAQGPSIDALPRDRIAFEAALGPTGVDASKTGWLPYTIMDGYQQLVRDFAFWRVDRVLAKSGASAKARAWYAADLKLREALVIRDIGVWAHYVGDGSQPMHVSIHYNGWGDYPNPKGFTQEKIHGPFEGAFVHDHVTEAGVHAVLPALATCGPTLAACTATYLKATLATTEPLYVLWGQGAFTTVGDAKGPAFATERVAAGAAELRDLIVRAWKDSAGVSVGYKPSYEVKAIEGGLIPPFGMMYGDD